MAEASSKDEALYRLEERVYGEVMDAVRASGAPEEARHEWEHAAMALLVEAQDAAAFGAFDPDAFFQRAEAIADSARSFSAS